MSRTLLRSTTALLLLGLAGTAFADQARFDGLANLPFEKNRPTAQTAATLKDELLFQRASQTYLWAMPLINTLGMKVGAEEAFGTGYNIMPIWSRAGHLAGLQAHRERAAPSCRGRRTPCHRSGLSSAW